MADCVYPWTKQMLVLMNPGAGHRSTPPLLPSSALDGLEQFVPPDRPTHASLVPPWKFKPLPELPRHMSTSCDKHDEDKILNARPGAPVGAQRSRDEDSNMKKLQHIVDLRQFLDEHFRHQKASRSCENLPKHPTSVSSTPTSQILRRPTTSPGGTRSFSAFVETTPEATWESPVHQSPPEVLVRQPSLQTTLNSMHPSLMPAPLVIDGLRTRPDVPPLPTPESIDFCHCHLPDPEHFSSGPGLESPHSYYRGSNAWHPAISEYSAYQTANPGRKNSDLLGRGSLDSQDPNRTRLYSFSSISRKQTYSDTDSDHGNAAVFIQKERLSRATNAAAPLTPPGSSHSNISRTVSYSPFPSTRPPVERPRQLAIPPTDYQKYGAKIFIEERKKQNRNTLLSKCVRKLLPWSWREVEAAKKDSKGTNSVSRTRSIKMVQKRRASDNKHKRRTGGIGKTVTVEDIEIVSPSSSPYPLPPGSPRQAPLPPRSTTPLATTPPAIPSLVFPDDFAIDEIFRGNTSTNESTKSNPSDEHENEDKDKNDRPCTSAGQHIGWSFMKWDPTREDGQRETTDDGRDSVDSKERLIHRSRSAMALGAGGCGLGIVAEGRTPDWL